MTHDWIESDDGEQCGAAARGSFLSGLGHESPEACQITCGSNPHCVAFTWEESTDFHPWKGGCEYVCNNAADSEGVCGAERARVQVGQLCSQANHQALPNARCYSKPCDQTSIPSRGDCSFYCSAGGAWPSRYTGATSGCSALKNENACVETGRDKCMWIPSKSPTHARCADRYNKPLQIRDALHYSGRRNHSHPVRLEKKD